jgi:hypothetical protein
MVQTVIWSTVKMGVIVEEVSLFPTADRSRAGPFEHDDPGVLPEHAIQCGRTTFLRATN